MRWWTYLTPTLAWGFMILMRITIRGENKMNELVKINYENERPTVSGRDLHEALEVKTAYKDWFPRMCEYGFEEGKDFSSFLSKSTGGRPSTDHQLTLDMAKEICMIQRTPIGKKCREYFIEVEKKYQDRYKDLSPAELLLEHAKMFVEQERRMTAVEGKVKQIETHLETHPEDYYTIAGYASLRGLLVDVNKANMLGRKASKLSREYDYEISKTKDPRFGTVNIYHEDILKEVFLGLSQSEQA